jgi:hypothetical protein
MHSRGDCNQSCRGKEVVLDRAHKGRALWFFSCPKLRSTCSWRAIWGFFFSSLGKLLLPNLKHSSCLRTSLPFLNVYCLFICSFLFDFLWMIFFPVCLQNSVVVQICGVSGSVLFFALWNFVGFSYTRFGGGRGAFRDHTAAAILFYTWKAAVVHPEWEGEEEAGGRRFIFQVAPRSQCQGQKFVGSTVFRCLLGSG